MTNEEKYQIILDRVNKHNSGGGQIISRRHFVNAFNKMQYHWFDFRMKQDEVDKVRQNELQQFTRTVCLSPSKDSKLSAYTAKVPKDFYYLKRVSALSTQGDCELEVWGRLIEEGAVNEYLSDCFNTPSFEWQESFYTLANNKIRFYYKDFQIKELVVTYYKCPQEIDMEEVGGKDIPCELSKSNLHEVLDLTALVLSGDSNDTPTYQLIANYIQQFN